MADPLDFLFEGKPPKSVTTYGQTVENIPKWMSDYTQGLIARANAAAAEPYIPYGGPRIAGFSPEQEAAFGLVEENVGAYQPYLERGAEGYGGGLEAASRISSAADPYLTEAGGRFTDPGMADQYMDPYIQNVLNRQESLATRTLEDEFMPRISGMFGGAGQYGSRGGTGSMEDIAVRGARDIQEGLEEQRLASLSGAYGQAADIYGADQGRIADVGRMRGALEEAQAGAMFQGAEGLGRMGEAAQMAGLRDAAALEGVGAQTRGLDQASLDLAHQDFLEQRNLPFERAGFMSDIIRGLPHGTSTQRTDVGPSPVYQPSPLSQLVGAYGTYRGLTEAEGGRVRKPYAKGGRVIDGNYSVVDGDVQEYQLGGLASAAGQAIRGGARRVVDWARSLYPNPGRSVGVAGGHFLKLDHKQD